MKLFALAALALAACAPPLPTAYTIYLADPYPFSSHFEAFDRAAADWSRDGLRLAVKVAPCPEAVPGVVCVYRHDSWPLNADGTWRLGWTTQTGGTAGDSSRIDFDGTLAAGPELDTVARHELGHALGLEHSPDPGALMYYDPPPGRDIGPVDVLALRWR